LKRIKVQVYLNDKLVDGAIMFSYLSYEHDVQVPAGQEEQFEQEHHQCPFLCHRDLMRVWSTDLIRRIELKGGLWAGVTTIRFYNNLTCFGYDGYNKQNKLVIALMIPIANLVELHIYANLNDDTVAELAKRKKFLSKEAAEDLK
jgi:hypothetical protein